MKAGQFRSYSLLVLVLVLDLIRVCVLVVVVVLDLPVRKATADQGRRGGGLED